MSAPAIAAIDDQTSAIVVQGAATGTLTIGSLEGGGTSGINYRNRTLILGGNNLSTVYAGEILGTGALIKTGTGTIVLSSNNLFLFFQNLIDHLLMSTF